MDQNQEKIQTIILCGGAGTRLQEETEFKPKPMVLVGGKPIVWHIMKIYDHHGHSDFILASGFKGEQIEEYVKNNNEFNALAVDTGLETPHGERVLKVKGHITNNIFMVTYGDGVADMDIKKLVEFHKSHGKMATITGVHPSSKWGLVNVDQNNIVTAFVEKPKLHDYVNGGFMVFNKEFFDYLKEGDMIEDGLARIIPKGELAMYKHEGFWYGMDTYKDFLHLNDLWNKDPKWKIWQD